MTTFYATIARGDMRPYMPDVPVLLPASSWARWQRKDGSLPPIKLPAQVKHAAADCGGFVASFKWGGEYKYTPQQYIDWLHTFPDGVLKWAAAMDYCCEDEITSGNQGIVVQRQNRTTTNAHLFWRYWWDVPWVWVPTVQGWHVEDYVRHAKALKPLIYDMMAYYQGRDDKANYFRVGIGTLCARADTDMIRRVVAAVGYELPEVPLHLWGVKLSTFQSDITLPGVVSVDSAAWNGAFGKDIERRKQASQNGIVRGKWNYEIALPEYLQKVNGAIKGTERPPITFAEAKEWKEYWARLKQQEMFTHAA